MASYNVTHNTTTEPTATGYRVTETTITSPVTTEYRSTDIGLTPAAGYHGTPVGATVGHHGSPINPLTGTTSPVGATAGYHGSPVGTTVGHHGSPVGTTVGHHGSPINPLTGTTTPVGATAGYYDTTSPVIPTTGTTTHTYPEKRVESIFMTGPPGSPHYLRTIERDHEEIKRLFQEYNSALSLKDKDELKNEIIRGLSIHDFISETILFPAYEREVPNGKDTLYPFRGKCADLRTMMVQMDKMKIDDLAFQPTFQTMMKQVEENFLFKEREMLSTLQAVISPARAEELGRDMDKARRSAPTRPHTNAAKSSVLGALAAPIDKLKDKARDFAGASRENQDIVSK